MGRLVGLRAGRRRTVTRRTCLALALATGLSSGCSGKDTTTTTPSSAVDTTAPTDDPLAGLDADVESLMEMFDVPGLALVVVHDGEVVVSKGYGTRTLGKDEPVDGDTVFAIASNTKAFIATAIGLLVADGTIGWDDRVVEHLPDLVLWDDYTTKHIRIRDLLSHRSGLATWAGDTSWIGSKLTTDQLMARLRYVPADHDFREAYGYTNLMFVVAGEVIRAKTGTRWEDFVEERVLKPLAMTRTNATVTALPKMDNIATPYMEIDGKLTAIEYLSVDNASAPGALNSSVNDLSRWLRTQLANGEFEGQQVIPAKVVAAMPSPSNLDRTQGPESGREDRPFFRLRTRVVSRRPPRGVRGDPRRRFARHDLPRHVAPRRRTRDRGAHQQREPRRRIRLQPRR